MYVHKAYRTKPVPSTGMGEGTATVNKNHHSHLDRSIYVTQDGLTKNEHKMKYLRVVTHTNKSLGRPKNRWEDDVKSDITRMKITKWKDCIREQTKWKTLVEKAKTSLKL